MTEFEKYARGNCGISSLKMHNYGSIMGRESIPQPVILEEHELKATAVDIFSRLLMDRIIVLGTPIYEDAANIIMAQLMYLNSQDNRKPIQLYINSPGGLVTSGMQIYDTMQMIKAPVQTICTGIAASMAAVILAGGEKNMRGSLPNAEIMIHQPLGGGYGQASDISIINAQIQKCKNKLYNILARDTGNTFEKIMKDADRDYWMDPYEATEYGIIDKVFTNKGLI
jgi:ATP-dependent Clp protease protease subunit